MCDCDYNNVFRNLMIEYLEAIYFTPFVKADKVKPIEFYINSHLKK